MVGYNRRFSPLARRLDDFIKASQEPLVQHIALMPAAFPSHIGCKILLREADE